MKINQMPSGVFHHTSVKGRQSSRAFVLVSKAMLSAAMFPNRH